jgi:hypothetical protein
MATATKRAMASKRAMVMATTWAITMATRLADNKEGSGKRQKPTNQQQWQ